MIPKIIHYCWFGGNPMTELAKKCMDSWQKFCPDYEIVRWDETNFDLDYCDYVREAYLAKKWAFVTDVVRLYALVLHGGIYMDTDVEVLKPLDDLLSYEAFSGFEDKNRIPTGLMASQKDQCLFIELLHEYDDIHFLQSDGSIDMTTNVKRITDACVKYGLLLNNTLQTVKGFTLFPTEYFCPRDSTTKMIHITGNTYTIHHFEGSWQTDEEKYKKELRRRIAKYMPPNVSNHTAAIITETKYHGIRQALSRTVQWSKDKKNRNNI